MRGPCTCRGTPAPRSRMLIPSPLERINERDPGPRDLAILHHDNATAYRPVHPVMIDELMSTEGARPWNQSGTRNRYVVQTPRRLFGRLGMQFTPDVLVRAEVLRGGCPDIFGRETVD